MSSPSVLHITQCCIYTRSQKKKKKVQLKVYKHVYRQTKHVYLYSIIINSWHDNYAVMDWMSVFCKLNAGHIPFLSCYSTTSKSTLETQELQKGSKWGTFQVASLCFQKTPLKCKLNATLIPPLSLAVLNAVTLFHFQKQTNQKNVHIQSSTSWVHSASPCLHSVVIHFNILLRNIFPWSVNKKRNRTENAGFKKWARMKD
jgi:hypothetical protein